MANRLKLDFSLNTTDERRDFVNKYIYQPEFEKRPLTEDELETIANYILWGKDPDGLSATQRGEIQIETRNKTWTRDDIESLDALIEQPTFNESTIQRPTEARPRIVRETFDRSKALRECPPHMVAVFKDLFRRIDELEICINFYEFAHGKRKEPPREALLVQFSPERIEALKNKASTWNQFKYLKQRHLIVELRREQFTLRDSFVSQITRHTLPEPEPAPTSIDFEFEIPVYPLGMKDSILGRQIFQELGELIPQNFEERDLKPIIRFYWQKKNEKRPAAYFDFTDLEHIYELFGQLEDLRDSETTQSLKQLIETLEYYIAQADLDEAQRAILDLKINKVKNADIAVQINAKYGKSYTDNYISTIFRQKIIPKINNAATYHTKIIENLSFPESFKKCNGCGRMLLIDTENFVRKARSKDGFASKCKVCDKADRQRRKSKEK